MAYKMADTLPEGFVFDDEPTPRQQAQSATYKTADTLPEGFVFDDEPAQEQTSWGDVATGAVKNFLPSVGNVITGMVKPAIDNIANIKNVGDALSLTASATNPAMQVAKEVGGLVAGGINNAMPESMQPDILAGDRKKASDIGDIYSDRYGSMEGFKRTLAQDPAAVMMDASMAFGGAGAAAKAGGLARVAEIANKAAVVTNPLYLPAKGVQVAANALPKATEFIKTPANLIGANPEKIAEEFANRPKLFETNDSQSMGAAGTSKEMNRATLAEQLGFTGDKGLTAGQLSRDPIQQAFESDASKIEGGMPLVERTVNQERHAHQKIDDFFEGTGATTGDLTSAGDAVSSHINDLAKVSKAKVNTEYAKAAASSEGDRLLQLNELADYLNTNRSSSSVSPILSVAKKQMLDMGWAERDPLNPSHIIAKDMPLREVEKLRQTIVNGTGFDAPNQYQAGKMKGLLDAKTDATGGDLYKSAREMHKGYADTFKNTPIISDLISSKKGTNQRKIALEKVYDHIEKSPAASIQVVKDLLNGSGEKGVQAWKEIQGRTIGKLAEEAKRIGTPNAAGESPVSVAGINKYIESLDKQGKLDLFFDTSQAEEIRGLGEITKTLMTHPSGAVNASNTGRVIANIAGMALDATISGALFGAPLPLVTGAKILRGKITGKRASAKVQAALNPKLPTGGLPPTPPPAGGLPPRP